MKKVSILLMVFAALILNACREEYDPPVVSTDHSFLVVEGVLNAGAGETNIQLTRTFKLDDTARLRPELNAEVTVEGNGSFMQPLFSLGNGTYHSPNLGLTIGNEYRLRIKTADGKEYVSEYVVAKAAPEIESIGWTRTADGVTVYVNSEDPTNSTRYYRWDYDETWEIHSYYHSFYIYTNNIVRERTADEDVSICWKGDKSKSITIGSTARLQSDVVFEAPVAKIPNGDEKLSVRYSILVRQYALDKAGFEFYELMKRNTESVGTVFDPQPSEIWGNIRCINDPDEMVIGYVSASTFTTKRAFISSAEVPGWFFSQYCPGVRVGNTPDSIQNAFNSGLSPYDAILSETSTAIVAYMSSYKTCVECTARGGTTDRPSFW